MKGMAGIIETIIIVLLVVTWGWKVGLTLLLLVTVFKALLEGIGELLVGINEKLSILIGEEVDNEESKLNTEN